MLFAEYDRSSTFKNFTDRLNFRRELQVYGISYISKIYCGKNEKLYESGKSGFKQMFFSVFGENWERNQ